MSRSHPAEAERPEMIQIRLRPQQRRQMVNMVRKGLSKKAVAEIFGVSRQTVWKWCKRAHHPGRESFRDDITLHSLEKNCVFCLINSDSFIATQIKAN